MQLWESNKPFPYKPTFSTSTFPYTWNCKQRLDRPTIPVYDNGQFWYPGDAAIPCRHQFLQNGISSQMIRAGYGNATTKTSSKKVIKKKKGKKNKNKKSATKESQQQEMTEIEKIPE